MSRPPAYPPDPAIAVEHAATAKRCAHCGRVKPVDAFRLLRDDDRRRTRPFSWCRSCERIYTHHRQQTASHLAWRREYEQRPEVIEARRESDRRRRKSEKRMAWNQSVRARILKCRRTARHQLRKATDPKRIAALKSLIAMHTAELERMDRTLQACLPNF